MHSKIEAFEKSLAKVFNSTKTKEVFFERDEKGNLLSFRCSFFDEPAPTKTNIGFQCGKKAE